MGAIFFYIFIYFVGYYGSNILNMLTVRPLVTNRYMAALIPVYGIAFMHAYMIVSRPLPAGSDITVEYALLVFVTLPVVVVTLGAAYFMWSSKDKRDVHSSDTPASEEQQSAETLTAKTIEPESQVQSENIGSSNVKPLKQTDTGNDKGSKET